MKANNRINMGVLPLQKIFGYKSKENLIVIGSTTDNWTSRKEAPKPLSKPADFIREKIPTPGTSKQ